MNTVMLLSATVAKPGTKDAQNWGLYDPTHETRDAPIGDVAGPKPGLNLNTPVECVCRSYEVKNLHSTSNSRVRTHRSIICTAKATVNHARV